MQIETKYFGKVDIQADKVIHFSTGLPGFSEEKSFVILDLPENEYIQILQSTTNKSLAFFITNPHQYYPDYTFSLDEAIKAALHIEVASDVAVFSIMTIQQPFLASTINLKAPLIINTKKMSAKQLILQGEQYEMRATIAASQKVGE